MTDHDQKTYSDLAAADLQAIERTARRLRSRAFHDAFARLAAAFRGPRDAKAPAAGRTA
ncbi:MAG: hypothetical protein AAF763_12905 [Pseudomonadota bacterium]